MDTYVQIPDCFDNQIINSLEVTFYQVKHQICINMIKSNYKEGMWLLDSKSLLLLESSNYYCQENEKNDIIYTVTNERNQYTHR